MCTVDNDLQTVHSARNPEIIAIGPMARSGFLNQKAKLLLDSLTRSRNALNHFTVVKVETSELMEFTRPFWASTAEFSSHQQGAAMLSGL